MLPVSTAIWDPQWFHDFTGDYDYIFKDKRGILNGIRIESIIEQGRNSNHGPEVCPCEQKDFTSCSFLRQYRENLEKINFDTLMADMQRLAAWYQKEENIQDEIIIVLIVYEVPTNPCSERQPLQDYFNSHGVECKELEYPIFRLDSLKYESFDF